MNSHRQCKFLHVDHGVEDAHNVTVLKYLARDLKLKPNLLLQLFQAGDMPSALRYFQYMWLATETQKRMTELFAPTG